jgi:membrane protein DedA with SNARE-associated domain/rhodanese-related sulfurtransferase
MRFFVEILLHYGYAVLFLAVLGQQSGVPIPADPFMVGMGSLAGDGHYSLANSIAIAWTAAMLGDLLWFRIGRHWGTRALGLLCRISIEPDSCVARTHSRFARSGPRGLLLSKFVPGLSAVATPVAGMIRMPLRQFVLWDGLGALLWVSTYLTLGFVFRRRLEQFAQFFEGARKSFGVLLIFLIAAYFGLKVYRRRRFLCSVAAAAVKPEEIRDRIERGPELFIVDLRSAAEIEAEPVALPGALLRPPEELIQRYVELPVDRDIILYCACPNDGASGKTTLELRKLGYQNVKALSGGLPAWTALGFPTEAVAGTEQAANPAA